MKASNIVTNKRRGAKGLGDNISAGQRYILRRVDLHLSAAPTTSESITVSKADPGDSAFNTNYYTRDLSVGSVTDLCIPFGDNYVYEADDEIRIAYTNTDGKTWGLTWVIELLED